ncbi:MAG: exodeoxyribonuclease single-stranded DNA-specific exonuclease [Pseudomonadota bacterium]
MTPSPLAPRLAQRPAQPMARDRLVLAGLHPVLADCLARRGVDDAAALDPALHRLLPARGLRNMEVAAREIGQAILAGQRLLIVGDYDADGATASAVMLRGLQRLGAAVSFLVPDRFRFGYGLTPGLVAELATAEAGALPHWIITVDNGISSFAGIKAAQDLGIQVLVTDHHLPGPTLPEALIINPQRADCGFASKHLAGVGVAFYLVVAIRAWLAQESPQHQGQELPRIDDLLSLVALGTVADLVRLDENNRRLVQQGLLRIRRGLAPAGLLALFEAAGRPYQEATAHDLGFFIGPRLNAAGRLADMRIGIRCLTTDDPAEARALATELHTLNQARRELQQTQSESASQQAAELVAATSGPSHGQAAQKALVLFDPSWHQGVVGLIAGRIKDQTHRPTLAFAPAEPGAELLKGSGRSVPGVHLRDLLARIDSLAPGLMTAFGGHAMAAGLSLPQTRLAEFTALLHQVADELVDPSLLSPILLTDGPLDPTDISLETAQALSQQIWGQGFPVPIFQNRFLVRQQHRLKDRHLKLDLVLADDPRRRLAGIWFDGPSLLPTEVVLAYQLEVNTYMGLSSLQLQIQAAEPVNPLH